jgi:hypothetical protein
MSVRKLAKALGLGASQTSELLRRGMPNDPEKAKDWRALYIRRRTRPQRRPVCRDTNPAAAVQPRAAEPAESDYPQAPKVIDFFGADQLGDEGLEASLPRLRKLESSTAAALERALKADNVTAAVALRREHCTALRTLYGAEEKLIKINVSRGKYVTLETALNMIDAALKEAILTIRRLPELARNPEERPRLEAFMNGVLDAIRAGAERSLNRSDSREPANHVVG